MRRTSLAFRLCTATALTGMLLGSMAPALAQGAPQGAPGPELAPPNAAPALPAAGDPPARVGRVARIGGTVSFHTSDETQWEPAQLNEPVTSGNAFWTQPGASTDLEVGGTRIVLDQTSEFGVDQLDDTNFNATASQGRIYLRVRNIQVGENTAIRTPRGTVVISAPGRYEIAVGDTETPTLVTVDEGAATIEGPGVNLSIGDHQTAQVSGAGTFTGVVVAEQRDPFLDGQIERDHPPRAFSSAPPPPVVQQMTGYDAVADTGVWDTTPEYGQVWYPPVQEGWVPYREGHWAFVAPWGWTWVDDAPWGFAPFHYGRWVEVGPRWGWIPVERGAAYESRPVYAPALVAFVGVGVGVAVGVGIGAAMGWIPLGPREAYHPPYRVSNNYVQRVNVTNVTNVTNIRNVSTTNYINARGAATVAPGSAFQNSQSLRGVARGVPATQVFALQPLARPSVNPTSATQGVSPAVARSLNLPAGQPGVNSPRPAPGPAFQQRPGAAAMGAAPMGAAAMGAAAMGAAAMGAAPMGAAPVGAASPHFPAPSAPAALRNEGAVGAPHSLPQMAVHGAPLAPISHPGGSSGGTPGSGTPGAGAPGGFGRVAAEPGQPNPAQHPNFSAPQAPAPHQAAPQVQPQPQFHPQVQPQAQPQPRAQPPQFHPQPQPQAQPQPRAEPPQFRPQPQPQVHTPPAPAPQIHVAPPPQPHPQGQPQPHAQQQHAPQRPEPHRG